MNKEKTVNLIAKPNMERFLGDLGAVLEKRLKTGTQLSINPAVDCDYVIEWMTKPVNEGGRGWGAEAVRSYLMAEGLRVYCPVCGVAVQPPVVIKC